MWRRFPSVLLGLVLLASPSPAAAQIVGSDICACQPSSYTFMLDFALDCETTTVSAEAGINETACVIETEDAGVTDLVPVAVSEILITEFDQNFNEVASAVLNETAFGDGESFSYTSITATMTDNLNATSIPAILQVSILGLNANASSVVNTWALLFDNSCSDVSPIVSVGDTVGWNRITRVGAPPEALCPLATTPSPSSFPPSTFPPSTPSPYYYGKGKGKGKGKGGSKKSKSSKKGGKGGSSKHGSKKGSSKKDHYYPYGKGGSKKGSKKGSSKGHYYGKGKGGPYYYYYDAVPGYDAVDPYYYYDSYYYGGTGAPLDPVPAP